MGASARREGPSRAKGSEGSGPRSGGAGPGPTGPHASSSWRGPLAAPRPPLRTAEKQAVWVASTAPKSL